MVFEFGIESATTAKLVSYTIWGAIIMIVLGIIGGSLIWWYKRKKWNLVVGVKMTRGKIMTISEIAKGHFDVGSGIVDIKRKGVKSVGMRPFDVRVYLQGERYLEVEMLSPTDFIPIHPKSYEHVTETIKGKDGEEDKTETYCVVELETDLSKRKTWKTYMERAAKNRFTLAGFLDAHWRAIELSIIVFIIFIGFSAMWMRLPSICSGGG